MTGFSFPPPPPPPPKAAPSQRPEQFHDAGRGGRGGRGGGRGNRGNFRGTGGQQQRGGHQQQSNPNHFVQNPNAIVNNNQSYGANQHSYSSTGGFQQNYQQGYQQNQALPTGAYVNPAFNAAQQQQYQSPTPQYGQPQQYFGQLNGSNNTYQGLNNSFVGQQNGPMNNYHNADDFSSGQKRTREEAFGRGGHRHPMKKPPSAPKVPAPPAVPSFGAPLLLPSKPPAPASAARAGGKGSHDKKRVSLFGLNSEGSADDVQADESEGEDVDEEAAFATETNGPLTIEYNGDTINLESSAELAEWINERKRRFPTKQRVEEKKSEVQMRMEERKRIEQETRAAAAAADPASSLVRLLPGQRERARDSKDQDRQKQKKQKDRLSAPLPAVAAVPAPPKQESSLEDARRELETQMQKVQELQRLLAESEKKASNVTNGTGNDDTAVIVASQPDVASATTVLKQTSSTAVDGEETTETSAKSAEALQALEAALDLLPEPPAEPAEQGIASHSVPEDDESSGEDSSSDSSSDSDDDDAPEEETSKSQGPVRVPAPNSERPTCQAFARTGHCRFGPKCRYRHVASEQTREKRSETGGAKRKTLFQRLVEQEREEENKLALQAIKHLGGVGFFSKK